MRAFLIFSILALVALPACNTETNTSDVNGNDETEVLRDSLARDDNGSPQINSDNDPGSSLLTRLAGAWQSKDDPKYLIQFEGGRFQEAYEGLIEADEPVKESKTCPEGPEGIEGDYFLVGTDVCYFVIEITDNTLSYSMVGGRGNTLDFVRTDQMELADTVWEGALFGEEVCEELRSVVLSGNTEGLSDYATEEVLETLAADARQGFAPEEDDVAVWANDNMACSISMPGDVWFELTLLGDGHVGHRAMSVVRRNSYDGR